MEGKGKRGKEICHFFFQVTSPSHPFDGSNAFQILVVCFEQFAHNIAILRVVSVQIVNAPLADPIPACFRPDLDHRSTQLVERRECSSRHSVGKGGSLMSECVFSSLRSGGPRRTARPATSPPCSSANTAIDRVFRGNLLRYMKMNRTREADGPMPLIWIHFFPGPPSRNSLPSILSKYGHW